MCQCYGYDIKCVSGMGVVVSVSVMGVVVSVSVLWG